MRVRAFTQDDGHIFCTEDQIQSEVTAFNDLLRKVYADFGFHDVAVKRRKEREAAVAGKEVDKLATGIEWHKTFHKIKIPPMVHLKVAGVYCSAWLPITVSFFTGWLAGILGIGGGLIRMPALIYLIGCPTHVAVGTDLFEVMISGLYGAASYTYKGRVELVAAIIMLVVFALAVAVASYSLGIQLPAPEARVDPNTISVSGPFANPGLRELAPGRYEAYIMAIGQGWYFNPREITVPAGSEVTFYITSPDVQHGFKLAGTNINMMVIPGQVSTLTRRFDTPGEYNWVCHEYCGTGHAAMYGTLTVTP
jgi:plastocyanin